MDNEELMETLRNFTEKQVNELSNKGKMVFYEIMDIADERDELKDRINTAIEYMNEWGNEPDYDMSIEMQEYPEFQKLLGILKGKK